MIRMRHAITAVVAALLALLLTACGGLPTTGPVNPGLPITDNEDNDDFVVFPDGPSKDATPQQIVEGFIAAGSGPRGTWETAKEFLAPGTDWNPRAGVVVYSPAQRTLQEMAEDEFLLSVTPVATVDATGELSTPGDPGEITLPFTLAQQSDGQWRITKAPDGIVLDRNLFARVYGSYALQFFDPTWTYLVPDERWFPRVYAATNIAEALIDGGPSAWLVGSVSNAFTDGARLATVSVPQRSGVAAVSLQDGARDLDQTTLDRMQTQLAVSLATAVPGGVDMLVDDQVLTATQLTPRRTTVDSAPLVRTADDFGFLSGSTVEEIDGLSQAIIKLDATDIEVDADRANAAVRVATGAVLSVAADGTTAVLDDRPGLVAPSIDPFGYVWSVPQSTPNALRAFAPGGAPVDIAGAWPGAVQVLAQRVSRDGTRLAGLVRDGDGYALWVAGIQRDRDQAPIGLGETKTVALLPGAGTALAWIDASTLAVITASDGDPYLYSQEVGAFGTLQPVPDAVTTVAGGAQSGGVRLRDSSGELYGGQRGANWQHLASGILVLAVQQGSPR